VKTKIQVDARKMVFIKAMKTKIQDEAKEKGLHKGNEDQNPG
jgi:hypothetical protein